MRPRTVAARPNSRPTARLSQSAQRAHVPASQPNSRARAQLALGYLPDAALRAEAVGVLCTAGAARAADEPLSLAITKAARTLLAADDGAVHRAVLLDVVRTVSLLCFVFRAFISRNTFLELCLQSLLLFACL